MKLNEDLVVLEVPIVREGQTVYLNLSLVLDPVQGPALVDTGLPGQAQLIGTLMAEAGVNVPDLTRIILTHQDIDHVGSLPDLVQISNARVMAHTIEAPYIDGTELPRYARPEILAQRPELRAVAEQFRATRVDERLQDGADLELAGGVRVIFTPGHTPGHICLYLERTKTLITGDALTSDQGRLQGPNPGATPDMLQAGRSVQKLAALDIKSIVCYHGGVVQDDANGQLQRVAQELAS